MRKFIWQCFGYVIKYMMLNREMAFVFHTSKQAQKSYFKKDLSKKINGAAVSFSSKERFSGLTIQAARNFLA